jgi:glycerol kinase
MSESTPQANGSPSNQEILNLLLSLQKDNAKLQQRIDELEQTTARSNSGATASHLAALDSNSEFIGAIDQGTTSSRFLIFDKEGQPVASHQIEFKQIYPNSG